jgi:hypothetical protein
MVLGVAAKPITRNIAKRSVDDIFKAIEKRGKKGKARALEEAADVEAANPTEFLNGQ